MQLSPTSLPKIKFCSCLKWDRNLGLGVPKIKELRQGVANQSLVASLAVRDLAFLCIFLVCHDLFCFPCLAMGVD